nr:hypothetical protein [Paenibacillus xylanexedens]
MQAIASIPNTMLNAWPLNLKTYLANNPAANNGKAIYKTNVSTIAADIALNALVPTSPRISSFTPPYMLKDWCPYRPQQKRCALCFKSIRAL